MNTAPNVTIIPAKIQTAENRDKYHQLRVAAYCRVSTEQEEQQNSYQVQIAYYTDLINRKKEWTLAGIFADEGISGTQTKKRTEFNCMIRMCRNKKIDLVITKSISRFARNTVDCLEYVRQLKDLGIGVIFEKENINTLTMTSEFMIALYGSVLEYQGQDEIISIENRLKEIDRSRNDLIGLIASGGCDEDKLDGEFEKLYMEEQSLKEQKED